MCPIQFLLGKWLKAQRCRQSPRLSVSPCGGRMGTWSGGAELFSLCLPRPRPRPRPRRPSLAQWEDARAASRPGRGGQGGPSSGSDVLRNADGAGLTRLNLLLGHGRSSQHHTLLPGTIKMLASFSHLPPFLFTPPLLEKLSSANRSRDPPCSALTRIYTEFQTLE